MRSTITICLLAAFLAAVPAAAAEQVQPRFRLGVYFEGSMLNDKNLTEFFGHSQKNLPGFEASVHTLYNIDVWATYRIYTDETKTSFYGSVDKLKINQASLGLIYRPIVWKVFEPFVGTGLEIYSYSEKVEGATDIPETSGNALGFHVQAGTYVRIFKFLDGKVFCPPQRGQEDLGRSPARRDNDAEPRRQGIRGGAELQVLIAEAVSESSNGTEPVESALRLSIGRPPVQAEHNEQGQRSEEQVGLQEVQACVRERVDRHINIGCQGERCG